MPENDRVTVLTRWNFMNLCIPKSLIQSEIFLVRLRRPARLDIHTKKFVFLFIYFSFISQEKLSAFITIYIRRCDFDCASCIYPNVARKIVCCLLIKLTKSLLARSTIQWNFILHFFILIKLIITDWSGKKSWKQKTAFRFLRVLIFNWRTQCIAKSFLYLPLARNSILYVHKNGKSTLIEICEVIFGETSWNLADGKSPDGKFSWWESQGENESWVSPIDDT